MLAEPHPNLLPRCAPRPSASAGWPSAAIVFVAASAALACGARDEAQAPPAGGASTGVAAPGPTQPGPPVPVVPAVSRWALDPENSSVSFVCNHVRSKVRGLFPLPAGTVVLDEDHPANTRIEATIDPRHVTTGVEERDTHLKGPDFFDVARFPTIRFASTGVTRASATAYTVIGELTILGTTRAVTLAVTAPPPFEHAGGIRRGIEATTSINRKDFGLAWEFPGEGPGVVVGDDIGITVNAELVLQPD